MAKEKNILGLEKASQLAKTGGLFLRSILSSKKRIVIALIVLFVIGIGGARFISSRVGQTASAKSVSQPVNRSFEFTALNNQGKPVIQKIKVTATTVEKTNQVLVKDQTFVAKNNKTFLILQLDLKNDATIPLNILPGDLVRLTVNGDEENKFAPDLHNNLVYVAAISTKPDRIGFVIPQDAKEFKLYVGELDGKKEEIPIKLPS
ncbi:hypothetical protein HYW55_03630 [Candidatus Gottesmanbacteria bacterium]|nr:hypothetical protein [Candidatus Gottesmanbacteria bacterium]